MPPVSSRVVLGVLLAVVGILLTAIDARADTIVKRGGQRLVGRIVAEEEGRIRIRVTSAGITSELWIDRGEILRIERGATPLEEFEERRARLLPHDRAGHQALIVWARDRQLLKEARELERGLPAVEIRARIHDHPRRWCRTCRATGVTECRPCEGEGVVRKPCVTCEGTGGTPCRACRGKEGATVRCRRCAGGGEVERFDPARGRKVKERCRDCRGSGEVECPRCDGRGSAPCTSCEGKEPPSSPCGACEGKPRSTCSTCQGGGLQPRPVSDAQLERESRERDKGERDMGERSESTREGAGGEGAGGEVPVPTPESPPKPPVPPRPPIKNPFDDPRRV
ncbi:MAG: hypothetical protein ACO4B4_05900 [Planctomycetota bacterium]